MPFNEIVLIAPFIIHYMYLSSFQKIFFAKCSFGKSLLVNLYFCPLNFEVVQFTHLLWTPIIINLSISCDLFLIMFFIWELELITPWKKTKVPKNTKYMGLKSFNLELTPRMY